ncbi:MAG: DUF2497 domain-containing protein [Alphaproteobacteria bacterium]|nr:MAG: DUF2497 domain-containing protein [Alphaproteobacteria bacterium]
MSPQMSEDNAQQEPTMEEILASIRRIISEDNEDTSTPAAAPAQSAAPEPEMDDEDMPSDDMQGVQEMIEEAVTTAVADAMEETSVVDDVEPFVDVLADEEEPVAAYDHPVAAPVEVLKVEESSVESVKFAKKPENDLMSDSAAGAAAASFENLARAMPVLEEDSRSLEGIVVEMLRPVLAAWLDQHLPKIVEQMVQKEIERVSRRDA